MTSRAEKRRRKGLRPANTRRTIRHVYTRDAGHLLLVTWDGGCSGEGVLQPPQYALVDRECEGRVVFRLNEREAEELGAFANPIPGERVVPLEVDEFYGARFRYARARLELSEAERSLADRRARLEARR